MLQYENAIFSEDRQVTSVEINGIRCAVPVSEDNRLFKFILARGISIADFVPSPPTVDDVCAAGSHRMQVLVGARDPKHLEIIIANVAREAIRMWRKGPAIWTPVQVARIGRLENIDRAIESNTPAGFTNHRHLPWRALRQMKMGAAKTSPVPNH